MTDPILDSVTEQCFKPMELVSENIQANSHRDFDYGFSECSIAAQPPDNRFRALLLNGDYGPRTLVAILVYAKNEADELQRQEAQLAKLELLLTSTLARLSTLELARPPAPAAALSQALD